MQIKTIHNWTISQNKYGFKLVNTKNREEFTFSNNDGNLDSAYLIPKKVLKWFKNYIKQQNL